MADQIGGFLRELNAQGFTLVKQKRNQHIKITHPAMRGSVYAACSPSDVRAIKNLRAEIRRRMQLASDPAPDARA